MSAAKNRMSSRHITSKSDSMKLSEDFSHIYVFKSPKLYFRFVMDICVVFSVSLSVLPWWW